MNTLPVLKTKYAFHALLWLLEPDLVLDVGSMDGSESKRFRKILADAGLVAFEANPHNYEAMRIDAELERQRIRIVNRLVSDADGEGSLFVQRPRGDVRAFNRGTSSMTRRDEAGSAVEEVRLAKTRLETFLTQEYSGATRVALWVDVEGHAYSVVNGIGDVRDRIKLMHVEVETSEQWPGQKLEAEVLGLAATLGLVPIARGAHPTQRDVILVNKEWYASHRRRVRAVLRLCSSAGPAVSRMLGWLNLGRLAGGTPSARQR